MEKRTCRKIVDVATINEHVSFVTKWRQKTCQGHRCSNVTPRVASGVHLHPRVGDIGGVTKASK